MRSILKMGPLMGLILSLIAFFSPPPIYAQVATTSTTLTAAVTTLTNPVCVAAATSIVVPSLSGSTAGTFLSVDQEIMQVRSNPSTLCYQVTRGMLGSPVTAHLNAAKVWVTQAASGSGDTSRPFTGGALAPVIPSGSCVQNQQYSLPVIIGGAPYGYTANGQLYTCYATSASAQGQWARIGDPVGYYGGVQASVAGAQVVTGSSFSVSGTNAITSFTLPTGFAAGMCFNIIPTGAFTTTATNNIAKASTAVANKTLTMCYDSVGTLNPSY